MATVGRLVFIVLVCLHIYYFSSAQIYKLKGSIVVFTCQFRDTNGNAMFWLYRTSTSGTWTTYTANTDIANVPAKPRISITGDTAAGEYKLNIRELQESDTGYYRCFLGGAVKVGDPQQLFVIVGPTDVQIINKVSDAKLEGTEGRSLQIKCEATGGSPQPDVKLLIAGSEKSAGKQSVTYTIQTLNGSHDRQMVQCLAGYTAINDFPLTDSAELLLKLKPLVPTLNLNSVSVIEGQTLVITCSSSGSRPAAVFQWEVSGADITVSSQIISTTEDQPSNTYTVVSRLTYTLTKDHNGQRLTCKAINPAAPDGVPSVPINIEVKYPPTVTVDSKTVTEDISPVVLTCNTDGNPNITTNYEWTHETLQGTSIRRLNGITSTLTLPSVNSSFQYQNTGRYNCSVGNGIPDSSSRRTGSGVLTVNAPPVFALYNSWTQKGEKGKPASISIDVYSVPSPLTTVQWYRGNTVVSGSGYRPSSPSTTVKVMFHGTEAEVGGFRVTLTINEVRESDFTSYRLVISNSRGSKEHNIVFMSISPPDPPRDVIVINETDNSLTVQWTAGYDGGYEQTFFILYQQQGKNKWSTVTGPKGIKGSSDEVHQLVISGLQYSTSYGIKVFAENRLNKSGETDITVGVTKGPPDSPKNLSVVDKTDNSLTVQWTVGYDGGYEQTFFIMYKQQGTKKWTTVAGPKGGSFDEVHRIKISGLEHFTTYEVKLFASNQFQKSAETEVTVGVTLINANYFTSLEQDKKTLQGVAAGISALSIILIVVNLILVYKLVAERRRKPTKLRQPYTGNKDIDCYDNVTETSGEKTEGDNYETLGLKEKANVYEDLGAENRGAQSKLYSNTLI